uniref:F-actin monooxygenase n=1 Tax=Glossina austeni TaxID=7395 RepID=A0A1A9VGD2_GLOAU
MSRSAYQRQQQKLQLQQQLLAQQQMAENEAAAAAAELFDLFCVATTMRQILGLHRNMCELIGLRPAPLNDFYPKVKAKVRSWKAQALWKKFDARASQRVYAKGNACTGARVLVIGAGPCGLRTAIEAQLLGAKVVVVEKRDRISRNNVLHLWPFVITDLRNLGAKKFYGKFCAGSIDHISIRQLQCILLKVALLLGVEIHEGVSFERTIEPTGDGCGWRAALSPIDHAVSHYEFDILIGADGKRNTLESFKRKEFRGKLAIAITANFINKKTEAEAKVEEISGVAFIFNQSFFKELYHTTGIDLENIVYYKDETHYFVMTAKKHSLIDKGVILQDFADPAELLAPANVNTDKLLDYAREAAEFSTKYQMPNLEFAVNHYGKPDVAMFDFTSMFAAESSCRVIVRKGFRLMQCLVGDSLLEPFWPTGSGCARGFLSSMDAAYAIKLWSNSFNSVLGVVAQRESIYRLLNQTTPENLQRDIGSYTVDPATRYPNLNRTSVNVWQIKHLVDTDDQQILEQTYMDTNTLQITQVDTPVKRKRRSGDSVPLSSILLRWVCAQLHSYEFVKELKEASDIFTNGKVLCALINRYRPDLVDMNAVKDLSPMESNDLAFRILEKEMHIQRIMNGRDSLQLQCIESKIWLNYLEQVCEVFRGEIPHIKHPKIDFTELREKYRLNNAHAQPDFSKLLQLSTKPPKSRSPLHDMVDVPHIVQRRSVLDEEKLKRQRKHEQLMANNNAGNTTGTGQAPTDTPRRAKRRRNNTDKAANIDRLSKRRQQRQQQTQNFYKSLHMLQANTLLRERDDNSPFEDYSIFLYRQQAPEFNDRVKDLERKLLYPDRERGDIPSALPRGNVDEQFSDRIRSMEQRITSRSGCGPEKKPKDLMRAIGKIDSSDWQIREIEKKIEQSKKTEVHGPKGREKVPKWSKEQFQARQNKMAKPNRQDSAEEKFKEIDQTLKNLDKQLKEGSVLEVGERGRNKVASIAGQFVKREDTSEEKNPPTVLAKPTAKVALAFKKQSASEKCHFCKQTVYLMEKLHTEGLIMHRACLKCHHCHSNLRLGAYAFDRDDPSGRFYCTQHFRLPAKAIRPVVRKQGQKKNAQQQAAAKPQEISPITSLDSIKAVLSASGDSEIKRGLVDNVTQMELLDRGQTPERIEFANTDNMSDGEPSEEHIIDEHEWSGRNFLPESNNDSASDLTSSDETDTESDSEMYEEANDSPLGAQTLQLASDWIGKQNYTETDDSDDFYDSSEGIADDGKDDTEGEEFQKARELRREEVRLQPLPPNLPTDTETEPKLLNQEIVIEENQNNEDVKKVQESDTKLSLTQSAIKRKESEKSGSSEQSFQSTISSLVNGYDTVKPVAVKITKADMEKLEQNSERKFSSEIEAISEKLYRLNNVMKLNKDLETLAKENLIRSDILKKLTLKEKWLTDNAPVTNNSTKFEEKIDKLLASKSRAAITDSKLSKVSTAIEKHVKDQINSSEKLESREQAKVDHLKDDKENVLQNHSLVTRSNSSKKATNNQDIANHLEQNVVHDKDNAKPTEKIQNNREEDLALKQQNKMEIENILNVVKTISISNGDDAPVKSTTASSLSEEVKETDAGKILYNATKKDKNISANKLKEIEVKNFSDTMDTIKSQMVVPTISSQAPSSVDLSKYFPHQKQEKNTSVNVNKNQKTLKDVDLTKYFPTSPAPQRRSSVVTVAEKLKKSQTEKALTSEVAPEQKPKTSLSNGNVQKTHKQPAIKKKSFSLKEHQLDGSTDVAKKKSPVKVVTTTAVATVAKKGNVRIIKKIVPRGTKAKKLSNQKIIKKSLIPRDEADKILDELLKDDFGEQQRSPSMEYQKLFKEDKSPSEDISDTIECILEAEGIDLGIPRKTKSQIDQGKKLLKTKSLGNEELEANISALSNNPAKEGGDRLSGVQNILKRFESMSSVDKSNDQKAAFKLRRMESTTSNLNKSSESLMSSDSLQQSDLEKTMEYLKSEWRSEATNFLQKKRSSYFAEKRTSQEKEEKQSFNNLSQSCTNDLPIQYRESKLAKFFGVKSKSPEKRKSPVKKTKKEKINEERKPIIYSSLEELALISMSKQLAKSKQDQKRLGASDETDSNVSQNVVESKEKEIPITEARRDSNVSLGSVASLTSEKSETENKRPLIEDIRNLPKTGCDKSLSNSRRSSQASIQSRASLGEITIQMKDATLSSSNVDQGEENVSNPLPTKKPSKLQANENCQQQASSDEDSIEKLFSQFSDEMLVNVEFDSNDELIAITPRAALTTEQEKQDVKTFENDKATENIYQSHFKTLNLEDASLAQNNFPIRPQRRQKSTSSSSDASVSMSQRIKNKLANLSPSDMPPSVQDLLQKMCPTEELFTQQSKAILKFPRLTDDEESLEEPLSTEPQDKPLVELVELNATNLPNIVVEASSPPPVAENKFAGESTSQRSSTNSESTVVHIAKHSTQPKTENVYEFSKILVPKKDSSPEWNMEQVISSPMPKRKSKINQNELNEGQEVQVFIDDALCKSNMKESEKSVKLQDGKPCGEKSKACLDLSSPQALPEESKRQAEALVKEGTPEWNMLLLPTSPMSRRKSHEMSRNFVLRELSPTNSIKMLNNIDANTEAAQKRLIEEFEMERRQALVQRDKQYQVLEKPEMTSKNSTSESGNNSNRTTPLSTPVKQSPRGSRTNSQLSLNTNRGGTPPMLKPLDVYGSSQSSQSSRRSSFAFIEMLDAKPIIAPMPKKLDLPILDMHGIPDNLAGPIPESMKNRPWPNPHTEDDDLTNDQNGTAINPLEETNVVQYDNALANAGPKRLWPDGKTMFKNEQATQRPGSRKDKPRSETPDVCDVREENLDESKTVSKSISDLSIATRSTGGALQSRSSADSDFSSRATLTESQKYGTQRPTRHQKLNNATLDASTQLLLARSKRLHNRKCDFVNERVVERNPYMRDVLNDNKKSFDTVSDSDDNDDVSTTYRPKRYTSTSNMTRFPTSRTLGTKHSAQKYGYVHPSANYNNSSFNSRRLPPLQTSLIAATNSSSNYHYPTSTLMGRSSYHANTAATKNYSRQSPFRYRDLKDSCVQTETESTSPDEVELNSATEISTDSEFDHDEIIRETPKIFIDDTHLRKPTKVQIKSSILPPTAASHKINSHPDTAQSKGGSYLAKYQSPPLPQFKPLVQVDPSLLITTTKRTALQNPRPGDYLLNKTASTEGIASKKSLELKKRYLLGEPSNGNKIQKSGSTSVLDSRIRSFQSNISECQKLLNPGSDISPAMKTFLDRTKLGEKPNQEMLPSAPNNILNDLRVEITIQKASSAASTDNEKENVFVTSKNELNKGMEYSETVNTALMESMGKNKTPTTPTNKIIEIIDLVTPEKENKFIQDNDNSKVIDLTSETPEKLSNAAGSPIKNVVNFVTSVVDSNKTVELSKDSLAKDNRTVIAEPDVSKDAKHCIPDILDHIETQEVSVSQSEENIGLLKNCESNDEKADYPEKVESSPNGNDVCDVQIEVPTIPWSKLKAGNISSTTGSSCSSHSSSVEDIEHYILESTTSPDTLNSAMVPSNHQVPRVEVHDSSGTLMQIDSLMIIDGKYIGDPDDLKYMEIPDGLIIPPQPPEVKTSVLEDQTELDTEPVTATPEPIECTIIDIRKELGNELQSLPAQGSSEVIDKGIPLKQKRYDLKFDTKNENKVESLKNLPLIVDQNVLEHAKAVKPVSLNLSTAQTKTVETPTTPLAIDMDKTPTADIQSRGSDSETEPTGTGQILTETELSDWTADDCISENFVDIEFVLNSNKGTIKRNKGNKVSKKKNDSAKLPSTSEVMQEVAKVAPVAEFEGILKSIDLDDIEFMDTGSDGSCGESPYSATNATMLLNRGYVEFVDRTIPPPVLRENKFDTFQPLIAKRDEKLGIDYIEQGAYIMQDDINKTPVNEIPHESSSKVLKTASLMTQSLTDSSTVNDMDEDSTCALTVQLSSVTTGTGTESSITAISQKSTSQQESEALTVVTSPFDSPSPKTQAGQGSETAEASTPSSSERLPKTSLSTGTLSSTSCSKVTPPRTDGTPVRRSTEEISYEEYVRALQQKIAQISTARADSLDARKQRRKSSKGEVPATNIAVNNSSPTVSTVSASNINTQTVIDLTTTTTATTPCNLKLSNNDVVENVTRKSAADAIETTNATKTSQVNKVPEIPTLTRKLEEITKERTKQKDLIHDLVMDKLQSKKQLNAEKRLNRSRQRSMPISPGNRGYASGSSLSPTPKLAAASNTADSNCTNQAHYHVSTAVAEVPSVDGRSPVRLFNSISFKENKSPSYTSPYGKADALSPKRSNVYKPRPLSETFDSGQLSTRCKLAKTPTFSQPTRPLSDDVNKSRQTPADSETTPSPPIRQNRGREALSPAATHSANLTDPKFSISTENLRNEARARARLKSNTELGLSPEEKMLLLRKRLQADYPKTNKEVTKFEKINTSKSVNDLASYGHNRQARKTPIAENFADFTSDPNLLLSSSSKPIKNKLGARVKDPERRKSLIQSLSNFFHKASTSNQQNREKKQEVVTNVTTSEGNSAPSERPSTGGSSSTSTSQTISGSIDGVLSRFRISPRSKEKSKSCFDLRNFGFGLYCVNKSNSLTNTNVATSCDEQIPPPIPPLPINYQRSDDESYTNETREQKKQRAVSKATRQAELKRLRIAQEIQREQEEIEVQLKELERRGVVIEKALRGEAQNYDNIYPSHNIGSDDEKLLKELLEIWRNITQLKKRDEELSIRQQELQLEHRHAQLKEELNLRLSCNKLDKSSADVAAEGAILNEMLEIVAKRAALRPSTSAVELLGASERLRSQEMETVANQIQLTPPHELIPDNDESNI